MAIKRQISKLCCAALLCFCTQLYPNINILKNTFNVLKDEYKEFSIINGVIAVETDYIMRLYDFGTLGHMRQVAMPGNKIVDVPDLATAPDLIKLVHLFFHRAPGTISRSDFVLTEVLLGAADETRLNIIKGLAWIMAQANKLEQIISASKKIEMRIEQRMKAINIKNLFMPDELVHLSYLAALDGAIPITEILERQPERLRLFRLIWESMREEKKSKAMFPQYTTNNVVLGIVYKLIGNNKRLLKEFYDKLNDILMQRPEIPGLTIFINNKILDQNWVEELFNPADRQALGGLLTFSADSPESLKEYYETIVYLALLPGPYPTASGYIAALYFYDPSDATKKVSVVDCTENVFRNLLNILFYDQYTLTFDLNRVPGIRPVQSLIQFYSSNNDAADTENNVLHNQWTTVVENIPFVAYNQKVGSEARAIDLRRKGYIKIPEIRDLDSKYIPADRGDIVYEIMGSAKNTVIVLNYLLGLDLYAQEPGNTPEEKLSHAFKRPDFIKTYFPLMCERIGIVFNGFYLLDGTRIDETIDAEDYADEEIRKIKLKVNKNAPGTDVELLMKGVHEELELIDNIITQNRVLEWFNQNFQTLINPERHFFDNYFISLPYLAAYKQHRQPIDFSKIDFLHTFNLFFYLPINDADYVTTLIDQLKLSKAQLNEQALHLLVYLSGTIPDEIQRKSANLKVFGLMLRLSRWTPKGGLVGFKNSSAEALIQAASDAIKSPRLLIMTDGVSLFDDLFEKGQGYPQAIQVASELPLESLQASLSLFKVLVPKGQGYPEAKKAASEAITFPDYRIQIIGLGLFKKLFEAGQGYPEAKKAASDAIKYADFEIQRTGIDLFEALFETGQGYPEAKKTASDAIKSANYGTRRIGIDLFEALFKKGQGYSEAIQAVFDAIKSKHDRGLRRFAGGTFGVILEKLEAMTPEERTNPQIKSAIEQAIQLGESVDTSTDEGKAIKKMADDFEQKMK